LMLTERCARSSTIFSPFQKLLNQKEIRKGIRLYCRQIAF
jgi:hypothetical protein